MRSTPLRHTLALGLLCPIITLARERRLALANEHAGPETPTLAALLNAVLSSAARRALDPALPPAGKIRLHRAVVALARAVRLARAEAAPCGVQAAPARTRKLPRQAPPPRAEGPAPDPVPYGIHTS